MFTWDTTQPLPSRLRELLDRAGAIQQASCESQEPDVLIFLPLDIILSSGMMSVHEITNSYKILLDSASRRVNSSKKPVLVNGSRLLSMTATELQKWEPGVALPKIETCFQSTQLHAAISNIVLREVPEILSLYLKLDEYSERGGAEVDESYTSRINANDSEKLINDLNTLHARHCHEIHLEKTYKQLIEIEQECERQFLQTSELAFKFKCTHKLVKKYEDLLHRLIALNMQNLK